MDSLIDRGLALPFHDIPGSPLDTSPVISVTMSTVVVRQQVEEYINNLQEDIVLAFEKLDPNAPPFKRDS